MTSKRALLCSPRLHRDRMIALGYGMVSHVLFLGSVAVMIWCLYWGLLPGLGPFAGPWRWIANFALLAQFPVLHSFLLAKRGRRVLMRLAPEPVSNRLQPTTYVTIASLQLLAVFLLWSSADAKVLWHPRGAVLFLHTALYVGSWILLAKSMWDAHLGVQTGYIGWLSIWRGLPRIPWPALPTTGIFRVCRQPIYFSFMLTLWTGPVWTLDKVFLALLWTAYCYWGPTLKEHRTEQAYGSDFIEYRRSVPYWPGGRVAKDRVGKIERQHSA
jgi:protein-S-isoprenylcysteine O-methyltransferase Ste14